MSFVFSTPPNPPPVPLPPLSNICDLLPHLPRHPVINPLWSTTAHHQLPTSNVQRAYHHRPRPLNRVDSPGPILSGIIYGLTWPQPHMVAFSPTRLFLLPALEDRGLSKAQNSNSNLVVVIFGRAASRSRRQAKWKDLK